jgi:RNA polymerase sigma factor (sigma-70 family)
MSNGRTEPILQHIHKLAESQTTARLPDRELLRRFARQHDEDAFAVLVRRHGSMVWHVCVRVLGNGPDAEDAFQAAFLILLGKAPSQHWHDSVGSWLYLVTYRAAIRARVAAARRDRHKGRAAVRSPAAPSDELAGRELEEVLDQELARLPEKYRAPLVLCCLEGTSRAEAARQLGWPLGTLKSRLERGRELLRRRLALRGVAPTAALAVTAVGHGLSRAALPALLVSRTVRVALLTAALGMAGSVPCQVAALSRGALRTMSLTKLKFVAAALLALAVLGTGITALAYQPLAATVAPSREEAQFTLAPDEARSGQPEHGGRAAVPDQGEGAAGSTPEAAVRAFLDHMNRYDLKGAVDFVTDGKVENAADWIADMLRKNGWQCTALNLHVETMGDSAVARVEHQVRGDPGAAARQAKNTGSRIETFRLRRVAGQWKIAPEEEGRENATEYGPIQVYAMMLARDEQAAAERRRKDLDRREKFDEYMKAVTEAGLFTGSVLVARDGEVLLGKGYGMANIEHSVPNTPKTRFDLASVGKTFTATLVLILQEEGKLCVKDPIDKFVEACPPAWQKITIHHLLSHTSGIPNYTELPDQYEKRALASFLPDALDRIKKMPLPFEPGERFSYSNTGYKLLHDVIRKASGKPFEELLHEKILAPLEMKDTGVLERPGVRQLIVKGLAAGYTDGVGPLEIAPWVHRSYGGGIYSTVEDLHLWGRAFFTDKLLPRRVVAAALSPVKGNYGYGWFVFDRAKHRFVLHGGNIPGCAVTFAVYPDDQVVIVVASNLDTAPTSRIHDDLARVLFGEEHRLPPAWKEVQVDPGIYDEYAGRYQSTSDPKFAITITKENDRLWNRIGDDLGAATMVLRPLSETRYFNKMFVLYEATFIKDATGRVSTLVADGPWGKQTLTKVK